jgi:hypothetical protein
MKKNSWLDHLKKEWKKEQKKDKPKSYSEVMKKAKKSYSK